MRGSRIGKALLLAAVVALLAGAGFAAAQALAAGPATAATTKTCSSGYVHAIIGGQEKCLKAGEFCSAQYETDYEKYGFACINGRLETSNSGTSTYSSTVTLTAPTTTADTTAPTTNTTTTNATTTVPAIGEPPPALGRTVLLRHRTRKRHCRLRALPDRRCSPGAYYLGLTKARICSSGFRTSTIRNVPQREKYAVEREYGLKAKLYGSTLEIDHIVSLELGGSNSIANLFPEKAHFRNGAPGFRAKDKLEDRLHDMVCAGQISLRSAQHKIASNWKKLYQRVFGTTP